MTRSAVVDIPLSSDLKKLFDVPIKVKGLSDDFHSTKVAKKLYTRSCEELTEKLTEKLSWEPKQRDSSILGSDAYYSDLRNVPYDMNVDKLKQFNAYISQLESQWSQRAELSKRELKNTVGIRIKEWVEESNDSLSDDCIDIICNDKKRNVDSKLTKLKISIEAEKTNFKIELNNLKKTLEKKLKIDDYSDALLLEQKLQTINTKYETNIKGLQSNYKQLDRYNKLIKSIENSYYPKVFSPPMSSNFEYLKNAFRIISMKEAILFSIDIEAFEMQNDIITEIGISIYDPRENLDSVMPIFKNYHIVIKESLHIRNSKYICDYKDCYLLNESIVLTLKESINFIQNLIDFYMIPQTQEDLTWKRSIVGHNVKQDINWLLDLGVKFPTEKINFDLTGNLMKNITVIDTEKIHKLLYGEIYSNLGKILKLYEIPHSFLHNAGNDAFFTLELLMVICDFKQRKIKRLDDLKYTGDKIRILIERDDEPQILPMSYILAVATAPNNDKASKKLIPQTQFHGLQYYSTAQNAFNSYL
ncbi:hypothetical protein KAFR_0D00350 [Kazachstania africana CBS 2517]|uniref:Gfd2/YDR514C-like C-terminal domain-containing protein n=1 Tax=Kazachstania africana (strain ATCC 22294 / BCRC 22015 / CBS 2517 / CECT 1963 / NBRC 1671 / NRRL Y-8276) TaxID=1071382 RepID=H2ATI2_KAZAF|nr:hypothetical protein KAFR_0D00350 [Kazachstania africana CBS 2517]CCF57682.1 hypothetical protein KAFR_0D00350 [Kazachstania africana CBS 2517]